MSEGIKRRDFLRVAGVSGAGAGLVGCSTQQVEKLIPYVTAPEGITPGVATWYSTVCGECSAGCGAWIKTREGRAIKLEGNPNHPISGGALCSRGQSALQGLYDPDRLTSPMRRGSEGYEAISWEEAERLLLDGVRSAGANVALVSPKAGPTLTRLGESLMAGVGGRRIEYDAASEAPLREAARIAFGTDAVPAYDFESAGIVFSFGADFLGSWVSPVEHNRGFARASVAGEGGGKSPFVFIGPRLSLTGQNADEWVPVEPGTEALVALAIANVIAREGGDAGPYADLLQAYGPEAVAAQVGLPVETIQDLAARFVEEGPGLAVGPGVAGQGANATATNVAVLLLNAIGGGRRPDTPAGGGAPECRREPGGRSCRSHRLDGGRAASGADPSQREPRVYAPARLRILGGARLRALQRRDHGPPRRDGDPGGPRPPGPALPRELGRLEPEARHLGGAAARDAAGSPLRLAGGRGYPPRTRRRARPGSRRRELLRLPALRLVGAPRGARVGGALRDVLAESSPGRGLRSFPARPRRPPSFRSPTAR